MASKGFRSFLKKNGAWAPVIIIGGIVAVIIGAYVIPWVFIWALNTLFGLSIQYNFYTWLAAVIILMFLFGWRGRK